MGWNMKANQGGGDFELPPAGNLGAVCVALIDLGTQQESFLGKAREVRQLAIVWELPGLINTKTGKNNVVCDKFTASLAQKANLRKVIESWRGAPIKDDEEFDLMKVVGAPCLLQISHDTTKTGREIYSIEAVTSLPKGMAKPEPSFPLVKFMVEEGPAAIPSHDWLPFLYGKSIPDIVKGCMEFQGKTPSSNGAPPKQPQAPLAPPPPSDSEVPF